jgi:hypothetical protein
MHLRPIEHRNQRILTTQQIADFYEADPQRIVNNFNRNKGRYTEGKHYFLLEGESLEAFKTSLEIADKLEATTHQNDEQSAATTTQFELSTELVNNTRLNKLYLWTEKGALMHAKSLNTDKAWERYENLVDDYYRRGDQIQNLQAVLALGQTVRTEFARLDARLDDLDEKTRALHLDDTDRAIIPVNLYRLAHTITDLQALVPKGRAGEEIRAQLATLTRMLKDIEQALIHESERYELLLDTYQMAIQALGEMSGDAPKLLEGPDDE